MDHHLTTTDLQILVAEVLVLLVLEVIHLAQQVLEEMVDLVL